jgi:hypothetical protein
MKTDRRWRGVVLIALVLWCVVSCGPSTDPAVEQVLSGTIDLESPQFKALTAAQQTEVLRQAKARSRPILGDGERYYPPGLEPKPANKS